MVEPSGEVGLQDVVDARRHEEVVLQEVYQRALVGVGKGVAETMLEQRPEDLKQLSEDEEPSVARRMETAKAFSSNTMVSVDGKESQSPSCRRATAIRCGSPSRGGVEVVGDGEGDTLQRAQGLKHQLDLGRPKASSNSQLEGSCIQKEDPVGYAQAHASKAQPATDVGQGEHEEVRAAEDHREKENRLPLPEELRQGLGERGDSGHGEAGDLGDAAAAKEATHGSTGCMPKQSNANDGSQSETNASQLPLQDRRGALPAAPGRRQRTRLVMETAGYCEPTIEKAVQCIQILPKERPRPQYVYINDRGEQMVEVEPGYLESLRGTVLVEASKIPTKSGTLRRLDSPDGEGADDEDGHSQNETKSQITQFTDNTGTNNPAQQFQMNQVRVFQKMNAELHSQPNLSETSPLAGTVGHNADECALPYRKLGSTTYQHQEGAQQYTQIANIATEHHNFEAMEQAHAPWARHQAENRAMPLEQLQKLKASAVSVPGRSHIAVNKLAELIEADNEAREESQRTATENERPWLTFNNNVFDIVAQKGTKEKQRTASITQSVKSCEMQSSGFTKEATATNTLKKQQISQGAVPSSGVTRSKKGADLINVERFGLLASTRPKSSQIGRGGLTALQRSKMLAMQRNNMKSTREDSGAFPQARGSLIRSTNQLSSTGASLKSPLDPATESNNGSALLRKRQEQGLGGYSNTSNPTKGGPIYNQIAKTHVPRNIGPAQRALVAEASYQRVDLMETRIRAYDRQQTHAAVRSQPRKADQDELADSLANPSIIPQQQSKRSSRSRQQSQLVTGAIGSRERYGEPEDDHSNFDTVEKALPDSKLQTISEEDMKKEMVAAFQKIRLDVYSDILRIKKPQTQAFVAAQLLCRLVCAFRGGAQRQVTDTKFPEWSLIQEFVHRKPNVIKFNQEITQLIQHMILSKDYLLQVKSDQLKNHLSKMAKIQQQYFAGKTKADVLRQFKTSKSFQTIVNLCYCIVRYVLYQAGKGHLLNLTVEHGAYRSQSSTSSFKRGERAESRSDGERASSANSQRSATGPRSAGKPALSSAKNSQGATTKSRAYSGRLFGARAKNQVAAQSRNTTHGTLASSNKANSTGPSALAASCQQLGRGVPRKRSPRLQLKDQMQATIDRLSTPKQQSAVRKSQPAGMTASRGNLAGPRQSLEQPRSRVAFRRPQAYEDEVHGRLCQAALDHFGGGGAAWTAAAPGRPATKNRMPGQQQRSQPNRSQRTTGGALHDKYSTASRQKMADASSASHHARTPVKPEDPTAPAEAPSCFDRLSRAYMQRTTSPLQAYQNSTHSQQKQLMGTDKSPGSIQNSWAHQVNDRTHSDLAPSNRQLLSSVQKPAVQHQRIQDFTDHQQGTPNGKDVERQASPRQLSQKKSKKLYEILLQQQRKKSTNKYEKLTLSSISKSKKKKNGHPVAEFSGRKGPAPLVQALAATVSTPGHASTLYNSNVFMTQKSKLGKENHRAAKAEEQHSESKPHIREPLAAGRAGRADGVDALSSELVKSPTSPLSVMTPDKNMVLHRPSASSLRMPMVTVAQQRNERLQKVADMLKNGAAPGRGGDTHGVQVPAGDGTAATPEGLSAQPPLPSSYQKSRKSRAERSQSKSGNRRDRQHRRRPAGDVVNGRSNLCSPGRDSNGPPSCPIDPREEEGDEQLRQFLELENKCGSFLNAQMPNGGESSAAYDPNAPQNQRDALLGADGQQADPTRLGSPSRDEAASPRMKDGQKEESQKPAKDGQAAIYSSYPAEWQRQGRPGSTTMAANLGRVDSAPQVEQPESASMSHMSSILQQMQPTAPHPIAQPEQLDLRSSIPQDEEARDAGTKPRAPAGPAAGLAAPVILFQEQAREGGSPTAAGASPSCDVPEGKSPFDFKGECKDSDELSNISQVDAKAEEVQRPAMLPESSSRESGRLSELVESKSSGSREPKKDELGLDSESLLSEEHQADDDAREALPSSQSRVEAYEIADRSRRTPDLGKQSPGESRPSMAYDPFAEATRIAAMIKAECREGDPAPEEVPIAGASTALRSLDNSEAKRAQDKSDHKKTCNTPNELSARHLLLQNRLNTAEPQRKFQPDAVVEESDDQRTQKLGTSTHTHSVMKSEAIVERQSSHDLLHKPSHSDSTFTMETAYGPGRGHPCQNAGQPSEGTACTPDAKRHALHVHTRFQSSMMQDGGGLYDADDAVKTAVVTVQPPVAIFGPQDPLVSAEQQKQFLTFNQYCELADGATERSGRAVEGLGQDPPASGLGAQTNTGVMTPRMYSTNDVHQSTAEYQTSPCAMVRIEQAIGRQGEGQRVDMGEDLCERAAAQEADTKRISEQIEETGRSSRRGSDNFVDDKGRNSEDEVVRSKQEAQIREKLDATGGQDQEQAASQGYQSKSGGRSSGEDGYYMQEIVSPFRQLRLSAYASGDGAGAGDSPQEYNKQMESTQWLINPVQVRRTTHVVDTERQSFFDLDRENGEDGAHLRSGRTSSPESLQVHPLQRVENPYLRPDFGRAADHLERRGTSPLISPGKLKAQVSQGRVAAMEQLLATQKTIEQNSPSRSQSGPGSTVNREMIERLKERRLLQRSTSREAAGGTVTLGTEEDEAAYQDAVPKSSVRRDTHDLIHDIQQRLLQRTKQYQ